MGNKCCSQLKGPCCSGLRGDVDPPSDVKKRSGDDIRAILKGGLPGLEWSNIHIVDREYGCYSKEDLERFLKSDAVDGFKYYAEKYDCDNFAISLAGRETEWYAKREDNLASGFGIVHGDIRKSEGDNDPRPHAVNYFIDDGGDLWLVEPQSDALFKPTSNSKFWFTLG